MTLEEKFEDFMESFHNYCGKVDILSSNLYGNPDMPGNKGDIAEIKDKLTSHNNFVNRLASLEGRVKVLMYIVGSVLLAGGGYGISTIV